MKEGRSNQDGLRDEIPIDEVGIEQVDQAVKDWLDLTVDARVEHPNREVRKVPVVFSSGERWVSSREQRAVRDANGLLVLPLIAVRRTGIEAVQTYLAPASEQPRIQVSRRISRKNAALRNAEAARSPSLAGAGRTVYEVISIPWPDFSQLRYEVVVQTQYIVQMNAILEKIFHSMDIQKSFVMPIENPGRRPETGVDFESRRPADRTGGYFVGFLEENVGSEDNFEEFTDTERVVKYTMSIRVPTYLQLDPEGTRPSVVVERTSFDVAFGGETVRTCETEEEIEDIFRIR